MADETWAAKVSSELKEEISELVKESGLSSKEFLEQLISQHKIGMLQGSDAQRSEDIQQVTYHLDKIKASFVGLVEKGIDLKDKFTESLEQESIIHKSITDQQQMAIKQAQEDRDKAILEKSALESLMTDINARSSELEEINTSQRITIQMQMDKLTQLEARIESVVELEQEVSRLNQESQRQSKKIESLEHEGLDYKRQLEIALVSIDAHKKESIRSTEQLVQVHQLELDKAILQTEKKIREEYFQKVEALTEKNQALNDKIHQIELAKKEAVVQHKIKGKQPSSVIKETEEEGV